MRISDWSSDVCSSDLDGLRCVDAGVDLLEQRADHACAPRIAIEFPQRIQAVLMPQDPAEYAILCTQADADDAPAIGKSVLQQAMQIPGLMCALKAAAADVTDALVAVSRVARQLAADPVPPALFGNAFSRCRVGDPTL